MWDFGRFGSITFDLKFLSAVLSIVLIDLILAGDNAVVIALAVRSLQKKQRMWGIAPGIGGRRAPEGGPDLFRGAIADKLPS